MIEKALECIKKVKNLTQEELTKQIPEIKHVFDNGFLTFKNLAEIKKKII